MTSLGTDMKITGITTFHAFASGRNNIFIEVATDDGITGVGEAYSIGPDRSVIAMIDEMTPWFVGQDPGRIEWLLRRAKNTMRFPLGQVAWSALSGIDIALWDIAGKILDAPIYQLLGGAAKDRIRLYISGGSAEAVHSAKQRGFNAVKTGPSLAENGVIKQPWDLKSEIARLRSMRDAGGDDFDILYDCHTQFKPEMALEFCTAIEEIRPFFVEEPMFTSDLGKMKWLADKVKVPLCQGESQFTKFGLQEMINQHHISFINPDVIHAGGISECKKLAAMAEANFIDVALHNAQSPVMTLAGLHVNACTTNCVIHEFNQARKYAAWEEDLYSGVTIKYEKGFAALPPGPGLGIDIDEKAAAKRPARPFARTRSTLQWPDGSVGDT